ncbi:hypothetical protein SYNGFB01_09370, partial [Synechococcus sp. GFB01]
MGRRSLGSARLRPGCGQHGTGVLLVAPMPEPIPPPGDPAQPRLELLTLLREGGRGAANRQGERVRQLFVTLERATPADLT